MKYVMEYIETNVGYFEVEAKNADDAVERFWKDVERWEIDLLRTDIAESNVYVDRVVWPKALLETVLEDDETETGGVSFHGETVMDFLSELSDEHGILSLDDLNDVLVLNGIKPVKWVD